MSKVGINQNSLKVRLKDLFPIRGGNMFFLTKIILVAVLLSGLISLSSYTSIANANTNQVITGDTQEYRIFEGQAPTYNHQMLAWQPIQCQAHLSGGTSRENSMIIQQRKLHYLQSLGLTTMDRFSPTPL